MNRIASRRGNHPVTLILWIVSLLVIALALIAIVFSMKSWFFTETEDSVCASQIRAHSSLAGITNNEVALQIDCPTQVVSVATTDEDEAKEAIAEEMASCWSQWGRGEIPLFGREDGMYCHVCSMVYVDGVDEVRGIEAYLDETQHKRGLTYAQYLSGTTSGEVFSAQDYPEKSTSVLPTEEPIGVIFYYAKGRTGLQRFGDAMIPSPAAGATIGVIGGAVAGKLVAVGVGAAATGVGLPVTIGTLGTATFVAGGSAVAATAGFFGSMLGKSEMSTLAMVVVRPLDAQNIQALGCQYAPVG